MRKLIWNNLYGLTIMTVLLLISVGTAVKYVSEWANYPNDWVVLGSLMACAVLGCFCTWVIVKIVKQFSLIIKNKYQDVPRRKTSRK